MEFQTGENSRPGFVRGTFAAFKYPNYRLWFAGRTMALLGYWMRLTTQGFLVFELTHSSAYLGYVTFAGGMSAWLFTLWGGVVADRVARRPLMICTQAIMMLLGVVLAVLTFTKVVQGWHIVGLAFVLGVVNSFDVPARQAFILDIVEREHLTNAIALNSTMVNVATAIGPAAAGITYSAFGPGWCFTISAVSFLPMIGALAFMRLKYGAAESIRASAFSDLRDGLTFVIREPNVRLLILLCVVVATFGISFVTLFPAWAVRVLGGDASTNGFLQSARGIGAVLGALFVASVGSKVTRGRVLMAGILLLPVALLVFSRVRSTPAALVLLGGVGGALMMFVILCKSLLQTLAPDALRGRVMSVYTLSFFGFLPIGGLLIGLVADSIGEPLAVAGCALLTLALAGTVFLAVPRLGKLL